MQNPRQEDFYPDQIDYKLEDIRYPKRLRWMFASYIIFKNVSIFRKPHRHRCLVPNNDSCEIFMWCENTL
ncbi:hypothetical protein HNY73_000279 [Argiope bruennichi]|uniref:Uncharacterized protein n=1 Tax=Argiope bruennichi TaxID=94029 RepID=A0A8T0FZZ7_ARGBR|nr:hypothetical protein HNY73_000279 [Argiope bruennichi]